jgi:ribonuclease-3
MIEAARDELELRLGYKFRNRELLERALTHRSWLEGRPRAEAAQQDNEQLEFLGDAVLGFVVSEALVRQRGEATEGQLSRWKAHLVSAAHLHQCAISLGLGEFLLLGRGEDRNGGRERRALLADALEAVIAALFLDGGMDTARSFIENRILMNFDDELDEMSLSNNQKMELQALARALNLPAPKYVVVGEQGPDHAKVFVVEARMGEFICARGEATTKRTASLVAAQRLLQMLKFQQELEKRQK